MELREHRDQLSFKDNFLPFGGQLSGDNRWIKLADLIPWDELERRLSGKKSARGAALRTSRILLHVAGHGLRLR